MFPAPLEESQKSQLATMAVVVGCLSAASGTFATAGQGVMAKGGW